MCLLSNISFVIVHIFISLIILEHLCLSMEIQVYYWPISNRELTTTRRTTRPNLRHIHLVGTPLLSHCAKDGICISSSACAWDHIVPNDSECIREHEDFVCCSATSVHIPQNVFAGYDWL
ncbi:uncharacterized protein LOC111352780 [Spodoptera litura]|uniref:Uncharacterized protein LOC111352780 n=1 Tax=Spodoptera litura TaxID=69820 RepID=A0A9J7IQA6_SPOLT|nr:uncharacterized protein LOC111352780 [Spodoptera litura]